MNVARSDLDRAAELLEQFSLSDRSAMLRKFRKRHGLTLAEIALLAELNKSTLSRYEREQTDLKLATFSRLEITMREIERARDVVDDYVRAAEDMRGKSSARKLHVKSSPARDTSGTLAALVPPRDAKNLKVWIADRIKLHVGFKREQDSIARLTQEYRDQIKEYEDRIQELRDLLRLETEAALKDSERDEKREQIQARAKRTTLEPAGE